MKRVIITAGPTREAIDPVRFISNRSTGKMGYAIAAEASKNSEVILISGPTSLAPPEGCTFISVISAEEMYQAVIDHLPEADVLIMTAAVADYRPALVHDQKMKKQDGDLVLRLERTKDILAEAGRMKQAGQTFIGFAAETENLLANAKDKLLRKKLDWIVANDVSRSDIGFGADENAVTIISPEQTLPLPKMSKKEVATEICQLF